MSGFLENKLAMRPPCSGFGSPLTRFFKLGQMLALLQHAATGCNAALIVSHQFKMRYYPFKLVLSAAIQLQYDPERG
jgi:hypothetical protein